MSLDKTTVETGVLSDSGSFYIEAKGSAGWIYDRLVVSTFDSSSDCEVYITVYDPDGKAFAETFLLGGNKSHTVSKKFSKKGNYKIYYNVYQGSTRIRAQFNP